MTNVTGKIESATGETLHATILFTSLSTPQFPPTIVQVNTVKRIKSDASTGEFEQELAAGNYLVQVSARGIETRFHIAVPDGSSDISIEELVTDTVAALPGDAPYTVWNGTRAGHITFDPVANPGVPTLSPVVYAGGHQDNLDLFEYVIVWETTDGYTIGSGGVLNTPPTGANNATRVTLPSPPSRVTAVHIYRSTNDSTTNRYLLASVAPSVAYYDDWEDTADFNARLDPLETVPAFNTTAGVIYSSPDQATLYFSSTGLRILSDLTVDSGSADFNCDQTRFNNGAVLIADLLQIGAAGSFRLIPGATSGHVLTSDANGYATWQAASGGSGGPGLTGSGSPEGVATAPAGTAYLDTATDSFWFKKTGSGNTGWVQLIA